MNQICVEMSCHIPVIATILISLVAIEHIYILWLEMFAWTTRGKKVFKSLPEHLFEPTKTLAANQGLYNGFLSAGLIWSLICQNQGNAYFFLGCVAVAGIYGGFTATRRIFFVQAVPALLGILALLLQI
jgi:putative membrane protein